MPASPEGPIDWGGFYLENRQALFLYAFSLAGSIDAAHDLLQEVFARLLAEQVRPSATLGYVLRCVRNLAVDRFRTRRPTVSLDAACTTAFLAEPTSDETDGVSARLRAALAALPDGQREPIVLRIFAGLSIEKAAEVLGRPFGTVASAYSRGLNELRNKLAGVRDDDRPGTRTSARQVARPGA